MFETGSYKFEIPKVNGLQSIIKVIGVGGGGSNAVNHMYRQGIKDVEFIVCNTDNQALSNSPVPNRLQIGANLTEGLGCGANPEVGKAAAIESKEQIREMLTGTKMLFVTAGMGGGTGTGAAPVIAKIAKDMDILTVGIVTAPFSFEGRKKMGQASQGLESLRQNCDTVIVILNDKLREIFGNLSIGQAFAQADNILTTAAKGIAEIITLAGYVNVDFQDVRAVMREAGAAVMGSAETRGENRARKAAEGALASPLLDNRDIMGAKRILLSIISGEEAELQMDELTEITQHIQDEAGEDAEMIFGHGVDPDLGDRIRVTVIATGFQSESQMTPKSQDKKVHDLDRAQGWLFATDNSVNENNDLEVRIKEEAKPEIKVEARPEPVPEIKPEARPEIRPDIRPENTPSIIKEDPLQRELIFAGPFNKIEEPKAEEDEGEDSLLNDDDFDDPEHYGDQVVSEDGMMELRSTKQRLKDQAEKRKQTLKQTRKHEMTMDEFNEKWALPAYLRRGVSMQDVPHSSQKFISKYNLNDDNNILGNNKFLHDNVD
jgi:cell division protein FtsZ